HEAHGSTRTYRWLRLVPPVSKESQFWCRTCPLLRRHWGGELTPSGLGLGIGQLLPVFHYPKRWPRRPLNRYRSTLHLHQGLQYGKVRHRNGGFSKTACQKTYSRTRRMAPCPHTI